MSPKRSGWARWEPILVDSRAKEISPSNAFRGTIARFFANDSKKKTRRRIAGQRKQNGNMAAVLGQRRSSSSAKQYRATKRIIVPRRFLEMERKGCTEKNQRLWVVFQRTLLVCMTCTAISLNGAKIGLENIHKITLLIRKVRVWAIIVYCGEVPGTDILFTAARRFVSRTLFFNECPAMASAFVSVLSDYGGDRQDRARRHHRGPEGRNPRPGRH